MTTKEEKPVEGAKADPKELKEPKAPAEPKENDPGDEAAPEGSEAADRPKKKHWAEKRFSELTYNWRQAERDRDHWRELATRQAAQPQQQSAQQQAQATPKPQAGQFQTTEDFLEALADWKSEQKLSEWDRKRREEAQKQEREQSAQKVHKTFAEREQKAREKYEDFDEVAYAPENPISELMADVIRRSDLGPDVAYFLGKNPDKGLSIAQMSDPASVALALGRIEAQLEAASQPQQQSSAPTTKPVTKAPPPPKTIAGSAPVQKQESEETVREFIARRNQEARKRRSI